MNAKPLSNHYSQLTPEERFRLIVAAGDRDDEAELDRPANASKRITFSNKDYSPFAHALHELAILILLELLEKAAWLPSSAWEPGPSRSGAIPK